jgi:hypothetical protein
MPCPGDAVARNVDGIPDQGAVRPTPAMNDDARPTFARRCTPAALRCFRGGVFTAVCLGVLALGGPPLHAQSRDQRVDLPQQQGAQANPSAAPQAPQQTQARVDPHHQPGLIDAVGSFLADSWDTVKSATELPISVPDDGTASTPPAQAPEAPAPAVQAASTQASATQAPSTQAPSTQAPATEGAAAPVAPVTEASGLIPTLGARDLVDGRKKCGHAPNGAPDCGGAVLALCQAKGFKTGVSVAIESARNCPATAWLSRGHSPRREDCRTDAYVTRAACR